MIQKLQNTIQKFIENDINLKSVSVLIIAHYMIQCSTVIMLNHVIIPVIIEGVYLDLINNWLH